MNHFINLKDIPAKDLRKIVADAKKRKNLRKKLSTLEIDKGAPLKGKLLIQMFEYDDPCSLLVSGAREYEKGFFG